MSVCPQSFFWWRSTVLVKCSVGSSSGSRRAKWYSHRRPGMQIVCKTHTDTQRQTQNKENRQRLGKLWMCAGRRRHVSSAAPRNVSLNAKNTHRLAEVDNKPPAAAQKHMIGIKLTIYTRPFPLLLSLPSPRHVTADMYRLLGLHGVEAKWKKKKPYQHKTKRRPSFHSAPPSGPPARAFISSEGLSRGSRGGMCFLKRG